MHSRFIVIPLLAAVAACGRSAPAPTSDSPSLSALSDAAVEARELATETDDPFEADVVAVEPAPIEDTGVLEITALGPDPVPVATFTLRRGETLAHYARWAELPVEVVAETSGIDLFAVLEVGTEIRVPVEPERRAELESARERHHLKRAEGYLASRGGSVRTDFYTVGTGDSAWTIARNEVGIPLWLLETYNPSVELDRLRPGQELMIPVIADTVVEADEVTPEE